MEVALTLAAVCLVAGIVGTLTWMLERDEWPTRPKEKGGKR